MNLVFWNNAAGFTRDARILTEIVRSLGHAVAWHHLCVPPVALRLRRRLHAMRLYDLNVFLQNVVPEWIPFARRNVLIPNPEHFADVGLKHLPQLDAIWSKTHSAVPAFAGFGPPSVFMGFTSEDRGAEFPPREAGSSPTDEMLHVAGQSSQKGTASLLSLWVAHPEWPQLTVVARRESGCQRPDQPMANLRFEDRFLRDDQLLALQREIAIHLCPSEVEGFGHTIVESLSVGALVLTQDAAPMNELVDGTCGVLVPAGPSTSMHRALRHAVNCDALQVGVERILGMGADERRFLRAAARERFVAFDDAFRRRAASLIEAVLT